MSVILKEPYGDWTAYDYPKDMRDLAYRRTTRLCKQHIIANVPLHKVIESAYLQGVIDGGQSVLEAQTPEPSDGER